METMNNHSEGLSLGEQRIKATRTNATADAAIAQQPHDSPLASSLASKDFAYGFAHGHTLLSGRMNNGNLCPPPDEHQSTAPEPGSASQSFSPELIAQIQRQNRFAQPQLVPKRAEIVSQSSTEENAGGETDTSGQSFEGMPTFARQPVLESSRLLQNAASPTAEAHPGGAGSNHAFADYQIQLMNLEQQNKKRLMMARQEQDVMAQHIADTDGPGDQVAENLPPAEQPPQQEEIPQTHYTISEDEIAAGIKDKLRAIQSKTDVSHPTADPAPPQSNLNEPNLGVPDQSGLRQYVRPARPAIHTYPQAPQIHYPPSQASGVAPCSKPQEPINSRAGTSQLLDAYYELQSGASHMAQNRIRPHQSRPPPNQDKAQVELDRDNTPNPEITICVDTPGLRAYAHGSGDHESTQSCNASNSHTTSGIRNDADLLQQMIGRIQELESENKKLREDNPPVEPVDDSSVNVQVFHCLTQDYDHDDEELVYLSEPDWEIRGGEATLRGRLPISDPIAYAGGQGDIAFILYKCYDTEHQVAAITEAMGNNEPLPKPEPARQDVLLVSEEMKEAVGALFAKYPTFREEFPEIDERERMYSPYIWWYHCRSVNSTKRLEPRHAELVKTLTDWIEANYASHYDQVEDRLKRGFVSNASIEYLIRPGNIVISDSESTPSGHLATSRPRNNKSERIPASTNDKKRKGTYQWSWEVYSRSLTYAGDFYWLAETIKISFEAETEDEEVDIACLGVIPIQYASEELRDRLKLRGETFWKCRDTRLVSYEGSSTLGKHAVCIDSTTYLLAFSQSGD